MIILQKRYAAESGWDIVSGDPSLVMDYDLVLAFGSRDLLSRGDLTDQILSEFQNSQVIFCSTCGEITGVEVTDETISVTAIKFKAARISTFSTSLSEWSNSYEAGKSLASQVSLKELKYLLVISDGQLVNGSELVSGLQANVPPGVMITGGLAGDGPKFSKTLVGLNEKPVEGRIVLTAIYGDITVAHGTMGGWTPFGPERLVTKSKGNVLYELDSKPALDVYKLYLGDYAKDLPESGLLFPLSVKMNAWGSSIVRTILGINEEEKSLTFAGNIPQQFYVRFMQASVDKLIDGALTAAHHSMLLSSRAPDLALLISCVGRKLVLNQRVEEELEVIRRVYGKKTVLSGFYSYGEISPSLNFAKCDLHNQTMTITTFTE